MATKNWKRGTTGFKTHEAPECHREAIGVIELSRKCADIGEKLSTYHSEEKSKTRQIFLTILRNTVEPRYLDYRLTRIPRYLEHFSVSLEFAPVKVPKNPR